MKGGLWVSLCKNNYKYQKSLPRGTQANTIINKNFFSGLLDNETPKGSYSLEATVVIPLLVCFFSILLIFFRIMQIRVSVQEALDYACRKTAVEASLVESPELLLASAEVFFHKELDQDELTNTYIKGKEYGITLLESSADGVYIDLIAKYDVILPTPIFSVGSVSVVQSASSHKWIGKTNEEEDGDDSYVYVTADSEVYHSTKECQCLDLTTKSHFSSEIAGLRNRWGEKYHACSYCVAGNKVANVVYLTDHGNLYHNDISCSSLKRTIYVIPKSEVGDLRPCFFCGG